MVDEAWTASPAGGAPMNEQQLPEPLVPAEVDLRGFSGFVLDVDRLLASELVALGKPEECWAAVMLWCRAWKQQPPASLPDDDRILAVFSGAGSRWPKVKEMALRGFVKCADGRLYHRVLAEEANKAWERRKKFKERSAKAHERRWSWNHHEQEPGAGEGGGEIRTGRPSRTPTAIQQGSIPGEKYNKDATSMLVASNKHATSMQTRMQEGADKQCLRFAVEGIEKRKEEKDMGEVSPIPPLEAFSSDKSSEKALSGEAPDPAPPNGKGRELHTQAREVLHYLNELTGKNFRPVEANLQFIVARLREGYSATRLKEIAMVKAEQWGADEKMAEYLRPATLYNRTKCAAYDGELTHASNKH